MVNLLVAYKSQWDSDAVVSKNDCGSASLAMILNYFGESLTTDAVQSKTGAGPGLVTFAQLKRAMDSLNYTSELLYNQTPENLRRFLDQGVPVMVLVHYGSLLSRQDTSFNGGHFFTVVGYRDDGYFVNDPNFKGGLRQDGDHHFYSKQEFETAWGNCNLDENPNNVIFVVHPKQAMPNADPLMNNVKASVYTMLVNKSTNWDEVADYFNLSEAQRVDRSMPGQILGHFDEVKQQNTQLQIEVKLTKQKAQDLEDLAKIDAPPTPPSKDPRESILTTDISVLVSQLYSKVFGGKKA